MHTRNKDFSIVKLITTIAIKVIFVITLSFIVGIVGTTQETLAAEDKEQEYVLYVNRAKNCVNVYKVDLETGDERPYKAFVCSTGRKGHTTPLGTYKTSDYYEWRQMIDYSWAQYAVRFNGYVLFHSVPYHSKNANDLEWEEFNKLGECASLGCVRLCVADAKWIYDNCKKGTKVIIYSDDEVAGPFGKPAIVRIKEDQDGNNMDPTEKYITDKS